MSTSSPTRAQLVLRSLHTALLGKSGSQVSSLSSSNPQKSSITRCPPIPGSTQDERVIENIEASRLTDEEIAEIQTNMSILSIGV